MPDPFIQLVSTTVVGDLHDSLYALTASGAVWYYDPEGEVWRPISLAREPLNAMPRPAPTPRTPTEPA